jgi:hypothetical protein
MSCVCCRTVATIDVSGELEAIAIASQLPWHAFRLIRSTHFNHAFDRPQDHSTLLRADNVFFSF